MIQLNAAPFHRGGSPVFRTLTSSSGFDSLSGTPLPTEMMHNARRSQGKDLHLAGLVEGPQVVEQNAWSPW